MKVSFENILNFVLLEIQYERIVSQFLFRMKNKNRKDITFLNFLKILMNSSRAEQPIIPDNYNTWPMYTIDDEIALDFIGKYENLFGDMEKICNKIGVPFDVTSFPMAKKAEKKYNYRDFYGEEERRIVEYLFKKEINYFGYKF